MHLKEIDELPCSLILEMLCKLGKSHNTIKISETIYAIITTLHTNKICKLQCPNPINFTGPSFLTLIKKILITYK